MADPAIAPGVVFRIALYYGLAGFGGGYSVLAQLRRDLVERRGLLSAEEFLVLAELSKSLPGTPATTLLALLGQRMGGVRGGFIAAGAFVLPSTVLMIGCGAAYSFVRTVAGLSLSFDGMNAAMIGVVGAVTVDLGRNALRSKRDLALALLCGALLCARLLSEPVLALAAVGVGALQGAWRARSAAAARPATTGERQPKSERLHSLALLVGARIVWTSGLRPLLELAGVFTPIGLTTFGGGLAMIPAIEHMVVVQHGWLDPKAFADAIALGQITPGPVAVCATFIGYRVAGVPGALVATIAIFLPATALALAAGHSVERFHSSPLVEGALRLLAPVVIGMLGAATFSLAHSAVGVPLNIAIAAVAFLVLVFRPVSPLWLLLGGGALRWSAHWVGVMV